MLMGSVTVGGGSPGRCGCEWDGWLPLARAGGARSLWPARFDRTIQPSKPMLRRHVVEIETAGEQRLVLAAMAQCLGEIIAKADPAFRPEVLACIDRMAARLKETGAVGPQA